MADIDSLEIEISAESSEAAEKVNSLTQALRELKSVIESSAFGSIKKQIEGVGQGASGAQAKVARKQEVLRDVRQKVQKSPLAEVRQTVSNATSVSRLEKQLAKAEMQAEKFGQELIALQDKLDLELSFDKNFQHTDTIREITDQIEALDQKALEADDTVRKLRDTIASIENPQIDSGVSKKIEDATSSAKGLYERKASSKSQPDYLQSISAPSSSGAYGNMSGLIEEIKEVTSATSGATSAASELGSAFQGAGASGMSAMGQLGSFVSMGGAIFQALKQQRDKNIEFLSSDRSFWTDSGLNDLPAMAQKAAATLMTVQPQLKAVVYAMRSLIQPGQELLGVLGNLAESGFKKAGNALKDFAASGFEKAGSAMKSLAGSIGTGIKSMGANIAQKFISPFSNAVSAIQRWKDSLGRMAFYRAVNTAVQTVTEGLKTGTENLYQFSRMAGGEFASSMDSLASSALYLQNSLGAMAAPLINAVAPAIDFVISKLVSLINMISALFAVISGAGSFTQAKKQAVSYGDALGGAAGSAKELQDYVLGIDELNIIREPSGGGGGGGGGGGMGFEDMFEEVELPDWAKEMQDAIKRGDWYGAGKILAEHLNKIVEDWDSRAWGEALGKKINNGLEFALGFLRNFNFDELGQKLANAINGIGDGIDFDTLGRVIGAGWNALFSTIDGFFTAFEWDTWGKRIGQAINGIVDEVDWAKIGKTVSDGFIGLFTLIDNAIKEINWPELGKSLATMLNNVNWYGIVFTGLLTILDGIKGAAAAIEAFAKDFKWDAVATQISGGINHALYTMSESEWRSVGASIGLLFTKAFGFVQDVLKGIDWPQLGRDIAALLEGVPWGPLLEAAGGAIAAGFNAVIDTAYETVHDSAFWNELGEGVKSGVTTFFNSFKIDKALDGLSQAIVNGINLAVAALVGLVQADAFWENLGAGIRTGLSNFFNGVSPSEVIGAITGFLQRVLNTAIEGISELASHGDWWAQLGTAIGNGINDLVNNTDWVALLTGVAKLATDILTGLANALRTIRWDEVWQTIKAAIDAVEWGPLVDAAMGFFAEAFKAKMELKLLGVKMFFTIGGKIGGEIIDGIVDGLEDIPILGWFVTLAENLFKHVWNIASTIGKAWKAIITGDWASIGGIIQTGWDNAMKITTESGDDLTRRFRDTGENIQKTTEFHSGGAAAAVEGAGRRIKTDWQDALDKALKDTQEKGSNIKETASGKFMEMQVDLFKTMGTIAQDIDTGWTNSETSTNTKWASIGTFLNTTWSGLQTAADLGFTAMSTSVKDNWDAAETKTDASWSAQDTLLKGIWAGLETTSKTAFENMYGTVNTNWTNADKSTTINWGNIVTTTNTKAGEALTAVKNNFNQVSGAVTGGLEAAKTAASGVDFKGVGENIVNGVSAGVRAKARELSETVSASIFQAAEAARRAARINSPSRLFRDDVGVYIGLGIAEGIQYSAKDIVSNIYDVNAQMLDAFDPSAFPSPEEMQFPVHEDYTARCQVEYVYDAQHEEDTAQRFSESVRAANGDVITTLYAIASQLVEAINDADNQAKVYIDGKEVTQSVERHQRERGANILAGGMI